MSFSFGAAPVSPFGAGRSGQTRGRMQGTMGQGVNYPSPFFDVAHTYLPTTVKQLFKYCRYYFMTNPLVNATVFKLAEYPVTDIIIDHENPVVKRRWMEYYHDHLRYRAFQVESGLDYFCYGNGLNSVSFPFQKYLTCRTCKWTERADKTKRFWTFTNLEFRLQCPRCGQTGPAIAYDHYYRNASGIRLLRWNVEDVEINYNDISGESTYFYTVPGPLRNDILIGKKDSVATTPQIFIQSIKQRKGVIFSKDNLFHLKRPTLAAQDRGWGTPLILPVLKDTFYLQIMKKAQEAVLLEHIVPLRLIFPQAASGTSDPFCVSPDTLVETPTGLLPACEVGTGDYLRSHTGAWRRVEAMKRRSIKGGEKVFKFKVASLAAFPFTISEDHPILAVPRAGGRKHPRRGLVDPEFIPALQLKKGDYVAYPVSRTTRAGEELDLADYIKERAVTDRWVYRRLNQEAAEIYEWMELSGDPKHAWGERKKILDEKGWSEQNYATAYSMRQEGSIDRVERFFQMSGSFAALVGWYLAEGSLNGPMVSFSLHLNEKVYANEIETLVEQLGYRGVSHHERPEQNGRSVQIEDVLLSELLVGMCGSGFSDKRLPEEIAEAEDHVVMAALSSLFRGDGCDFETETNRVALKLANPSLILEVRRLLLSFGLIGGTIKEEPTETSKFRTTAYHLNYNGKAADRLRVLLQGERFVSTVAQKSGLFRNGYVLLRIDDIEEVDGVPEVIGFQMHGDRSFCVAGVATHNTTINLVDWRDQVASEIARWRYDNNYIPIMPLPLGQQSIGGDGRALLLFNEMQSLSEHIIMGMGVPREFLMGGMSYAGTNVSMRMLENAFLSYVGRHRLMARWVMKMVAHFMGWPEANVRFKPFKMADDLQRKAYIFQLNQAGKVSDQTLLADADLEQEEEDEIMIRETDKRLEATKKQQLAMAEVQGEQQVIMMKQQAKAQEAMMAAQQAPNAPGEPGGPADGSMGAPAPEGAMAQVQSPLNAGQDLQAQGQQQGGVDIQQMAQSYAEQILQLPPDQQQMAIDAIAAQSPELAQLVQQFLSQMGGGQQQSTGVDQRPLPDKLPARRDAQLV